MIKERFAEEELSLPYFSDQFHSGRSEMGSNVSRLFIEMYVTYSVSL